MQAILLDRDGVLNRERADYVKSWQEFQFLPGVLPALARLATLAVPIVVVTNQSAIGRGIIEAAVVTELHQRLHEVVTKAGGRIDAFFVCPHHPADNCRCRKPQPGLLQQAAHQFAFSLTEAVFIGDAMTDYEAACAAGCHAILVKSGRQGVDLDRLFVDAVLPPPIVADLAAAVDLLFNRDRAIHNG
ncbi:MAG: HAD family hydrolase [Caldilinea sp. CFX5]|nr:HAD family hydrolase [Caldilinea sp. CFX5]